MADETDHPAFSDDDNDINPCPDCSRSTYWDEEKMQYRHVHFSYRGCFLIPAEVPEMPDMLAMAVFAAQCHHDFYVGDVEKMPDTLDVFWEWHTPTGDWMVETDMGAENHIESMAWTV